MHYSESHLQKATNTQIALNRQMTYLYDNLMSIFVEKMKNYSENVVLIEVRRLNGTIETLQFGKYQFNPLLNKYDNHGAEILFTFKQVELNEISKTGDIILSFSVFDPNTKEYIYCHEEDVRYKEETSNMRYPLNVFIEEDYV